MVIASQHPKAERAFTGEGMEERFLLYRIKLNSCRISARDKEFSVTVEPDFADPIAPGFDFASVAASIAQDPIVLKLAVKLTFNGMVMQNAL
jgi:hypothetical protein